MWTYEQFVEELKRIGFDVPDVPVEPAEPKAKKKVPSFDYWHGRDSLQHDLCYGGLVLYCENTYNIKPWMLKPALVNAWESGGVTGGSCWDDGDRTHRYTTGEPEPLWDDLDRILEHFCPNITYIRYKRLLAFVKTGEYTRNEYYGNSTTFAHKALYLSDLFQYLSERNLFEIEPGDRPDNYMDKS